jgi:hypothetical protein
MERTSVGSMPGPSSATAVTTLSPKMSILTSTA